MKDSSKRPFGSRIAETDLYQLLLSSLDMNLFDFINRYFQKDDLKQILNSIGLKVNGKKNELIKRILDEGVVDIEPLLLYLNKGNLKFICEDNDLRVGGTKDEMFDRIVENIKIKKPERKKKKGKIMRSVESDNVFVSYFTILVILAPIFIVVYFALNILTDIPPSSLISTIIVAPFFVAGALVSAVRMRK